MASAGGIFSASSPDALCVIAWIGTIPPVDGRANRTQQGTTCKRMLAYSTLSQLGLHDMAVGLGSGGGRAMFHLFTPPLSLKRCSFSAPGSVLVALHHEQPTFGKMVCGQRSQNIFP